MSCQTNEKKSFDKFNVDHTISKNDTIKLFSNLPELKII